jgi:hypothetical protein
VDWAKAVEINRAALLSIVAGLFAMLGLDGSATLQRMTPRLHRAALRVLRPAESAVRRLIVMAAVGIAIQPAPPSRPMPNKLPGKDRRPSAGRVSFQLYDPRKSFVVRRRRACFRVGILTHDPRIAAMRPPPQSAPPIFDDGLINPASLSRRLNALKAALEDVPRQAKRLVRWRASRERQQAIRPTFIWPLRPGLPPGYRRKPVREVDYVLHECHGLAFHAINLNTS